MIEGLSRRLSQECAAANARALVDNCRENLPIIRACRGVRDLAGIMCGAPIVVVGAGPSLDGALPVLEARRPFIVAVDRAVRPLLTAGITPDWIVSVDRTPLCAEKMRGLKGLEKTPLLFHPCITPETVRQHPGPLYTFDYPNLIKGKGSLRLGTGVITYAAALAQLLGGDPVILAGADLSYPVEGRTHAAGVPRLGMDGQIPRLELASTDGGMVWTDGFMAACVEELSDFEGNLFQTSPHGADIPGWKFKPLEEVL